MVEADKIKLDDIPTENLPTPAEAIDGLAWLLDIASYSDVDATTDEGAEKILARWQMGTLAIESLKRAIKLSSSLKIKTNQSEVNMSMKNYIESYNLGYVDTMERIYRGIDKQKYIHNLKTEMPFDPYLEDTERFENFAFLVGKTDAIVKFLENK